MKAFSERSSVSLSVPGPLLQSTSPTPSGGVGDDSDDHLNLFPTASRNPNKAIVTIDAQTSKILIVNEMTCELFGYGPSELLGMKVQNLLFEPYCGEKRALVEQNISASGQTQLVSGKVVSNERVGGGNGLFAILYCPFTSVIGPVDGCYHSV